MKKLTRLQKVIYLFLGFFLGIIFSKNSFAKAALDIWSMSGNDIYTTNLGEVGIGTIDPQVLLHLGNGGTKQGYLRLESSTNANREGNMYVDSGGGLHLDTASNSYPIQIDGSKVVLGVTGNVGIGTVNPNVALHVGNGGSKQGYIRLEDRLNTNREGNVYIDSGGGLHLDTASNNYPIRIDGSKVVLGVTGNVGIGTTSPTEKLEVNGDIKIQSGGKIYSDGDICIGNCP